MITAFENVNKDVPESLRKLHQLYQKRVQDGEMDRRRNLGYAGKGYKFDKEEDDKVKELRLELSKGYGMVVDKDDDGDNEDAEKGVSKEAQEKYEQI